MNRKIFLYTIFGLMLLLLPHNVKAVELITNGGFETGNFTGWTTINAPNPFEPWAVTGSGAGFVDSPLPTATQVTQGSFNAWQTVTSDPGSFLLYQNITIPAGNSVQLRWSHRYQMNLTTYCGGTTSCGTATFAVEVLNTSNVLLQTLYTITTLPDTNTNTGWTNNVRNLSAYAGQTIRIRFRTTVTESLDGPGRIEIDGVSANAFVPTAANVAVGGRLLTSGGAGISRADVTLTNSAGVSRSASTNSFGYYKFDDVPAGDTYILSVRNKKYLFTDSPRVINVQNDLTDVDFIASP
jgi:hypothetical protein